MRYMLQVRFHDAADRLAAMSETERQEVFAEFEALGELPEILDGNQLQPAETAATVYVEGGEVRVAPGTDGVPGSALDGYYVCEAPDLDAAVALAARIPVARLGGTVEVRGLVRQGQAAPAT